MPVFDAFNTKCFLYTYKTGLLSPFAHDLKLQMTKFEIKADGASRDASKWRNIQAVFNTVHLRTVCAMKKGAENAGGLSKQDRRDIEKNIACSVLRPDEFPRIHFKSRTISGNSECFRINGELTLCGVTRNIIVPVKKQKAGYCAEAVFDQRDFGIKPFSALMGAMQIKPEVKVRILLCP